jgi:hypothetical protein
MILFIVIIKFYLTMSFAHRLLTNSNAFRAVLSLTSFIGTFDFTFGFLTLDLTYRIFGFLTSGSACGWLANWLANC